MALSVAPADPRSRKPVLALATTAGAERIVQLCNIEAMAQIAEWDRDMDPDFDPDFVVATARSTERLEGNRLGPEGAAVHSGETWYDLKFKCELSTSAETVAAFEFDLGAAIPLLEVERLGLPPVTANDDR